MLVIVRGVIWVGGWITGTRLARFTRGFIKTILPYCWHHKGTGNFKGPATFVDLLFKCLIVINITHAFFTRTGEGTQSAELKKLGLLTCSLSWLHFRLMRRGKGTIDPN